MNQSIRVERIDDIVYLYIPPFFTSKVYFQIIEMCKHLQKFPPKALITQ